MRFIGTKPITPREFILLELIAAGLRNVDIGRVTGTTEYVIKNYLLKLYDKIGMSSRLEAALWWQSRHPTQVPREVIPYDEWQAAKIKHQPTVEKP